jgi:peptidoglycan/xylan/chitin deacetylase (PgdA/CDA1 family)
MNNQSDVQTNADIDYFNKLSEELAAAKAKSAELAKIAEQQKANSKSSVQKKYDPLTSDEIEQINNIYKHTDHKRVFITFDDGPSSSITPQVLDILNQYNVKATFFVLGMNAKAYPSLIKREYDEGHSIQNHTYTHSYKTIYTNTSVFFDEFNRTQTAIQNALNMPSYRSLVVRMPGGSNGGKYNSQKQDLKVQLHEKGIANLDWNALTKDAEGAKTKEAIMNNVVTETEGKTSVVLLMHDAADKKITVETLPDVLQYFIDNNYSFLTLDDYLGRTHLPIN